MWLPHQNSDNCTLQPLLPACRCSPCRMEFELSPYAVNCHPSAPCAAHYWYDDWLPLYQLLLKNEGGVAVHTFASVLEQAHQEVEAQQGEPRRTLALSPKVLGPAMRHAHAFMHRSNCPKRCGADVFSTPLSKCAACSGFLLRERGLAAVADAVPAPAAAPAPAPAAAGCPALQVPAAGEVAAQPGGQAAGTVMCWGHVVSLSMPNIDLASRCFCPSLPIWTEHAVASQHQSMPKLTQSSPCPLCPAVDDAGGADLEALLLAAGLVPLEPSGSAAETRYRLLPKVRPFLLPPQPTTFKPKQHAVWMCWLLI